MLYIISTLWIIFSVITYGYCVAYMQAEFYDPDISINEDRIQAVFLALFGPIALLACICVFGTFKHGWKL